MLPKLHLRSLGLLVLVLTACGPGAAPAIDYGHLECSHCRMTVVDEQFGALLVTTKGRQYAFDAPECMVPFLENGTVSAAEIKGLYVSDYANPGQLLDATTAFYLHSPEIKSPMAGNVAAFATEDARQQAHHTLGGALLTWAEVQQRFSKR